MEITFHTILGSVVLILILLYVLRTLFRLNSEGFTMNTAPPNGITQLAHFCPNNSVYFEKTIMTGNNGKPNWTCYPTGISAADSIFSTKNSNSMVKIIYPKGYSVSLYSSIDGSGTPIQVLTDSTPNIDKSIEGFNLFVTQGTFIFSSVNILSKPNINDSPENIYHKGHKGHKGHKHHKKYLDQFYNSSKCTGLSAAAKAAAAAADAKVAADADRAANLALLVSKALAENKTLSNDGLSVTCPSGDKPIINDNSMRNTKFTAEKKPPLSIFDESCGSNNYNFDPDTEN